MKKNYLYPQISVQYFSEQEVVLASGLAEDDFNDGYNVTQVL